jgi:hypothetical protein
MESRLDSILYHAPPTFGEASAADSDEEAMAILLIDVGERE